MDNMGKALHMATGLLLFIIAMTSSILLYSQIIDFANTSLVISDMGNRAESMMIDESPTREIREAEIIMSVIHINTLSVDEIRVTASGSTTTFAPNLDDTRYVKVDNQNKEIDLYDFETYIENGIYRMTFANNVLTYTKIAEEGG